MTAGKNGYLGGGKAGLQDEAVKACAGGQGKEPQPRGNM